MMMWSICSCVLPSGDVRIILWISLGGNRVPSMAKLFYTRKLRSLRPLSLLLRLLLFPHYLFTAFIVFCNASVEISNHTQHIHHMMVPLEQFAVAGHRKNLSSLPSGFHSINAFAALSDMMIATPSVCWLSSRPECFTVCLFLSFILPDITHLASLKPMISILYLSISFTTWVSLPV